MADLISAIAVMSNTKSKKMGSLETCGYSLNQHNEKIIEEQRNVNVLKIFINFSKKIMISLTVVIQFCKYQQNSISFER